MSNIDYRDLELTYTSVLYFQYFKKYTAILFLNWLKIYRDAAWLNFNEAMINLFFSIIGKRILQFLGLNHYLLSFSLKSVSEHHDKLQFFGSHDNQKLMLCICEPFLFIYGKNSFASVSNIISISKKFQIESHKNFRQYSLFFILQVSKIRGFWFWFFYSVFKNEIWKAKPITQSIKTIKLDLRIFLVSLHTCSLF